MRAHLTAGFQQVQQAEAVLEGFRSTLAERGTMRSVGFSYPPRSEQALAIIGRLAGAAPIGKQPSTDASRSP